MRPLVKTGPENKGAGHSRPPPPRGEDSTYIPPRALLRFGEGVVHGNCQHGLHRNTHDIMRNDPRVKASPTHRNVSPSAHPHTVDLPVHGQTEALLEANDATLIAALSPPPPPPLAPLLTLTLVSMQRVTPPESRLRRFGAPFHNFHHHRHHRDQQRLSAAARPAWPPARHE